MLETILDPDEAKQSRLDLKTFKTCIGDILTNQNDRLTVIAFARHNNQPVALAAFKKRAYNVDMIVNLPGQTIVSDVLQTRRKTHWEVEYVVRRVQLKSQCLGDIVLSCGLEKLHQLCLSQSRVTTNVWLIVANSFLNSSAIRLYLACGFAMSAMYHSTLMMVLSNLDQGKVDKACRSMKRQLESVFLLPGLKLLSNPSTRQAGQPISPDHQVCTPFFKRQPLLETVFT